jgi:hypothetical protein
MATADKPHSPLTVESTPLLVDATAAAALCGKHLRTRRAWWATGPQAGSRGQSSGRSLMSIFSEPEAWVAARCPPRKD